MKGMLTESGESKSLSWRALLAPDLWITPVCLSVLLVIIAQFNFLAFHTLAEFFAITIAFVMFSLAWATKSFNRNNFLLFLACGYFWIGAMDLLHALSYKGVNIFSQNESYQSIQFWIAVRFEEALLLFFAPFASRRNQNFPLLLILFGMISLVLSVLIFSGNFPVMFIEGVGLTQVKIYSEYIIDLILALSLITLFNIAEGLNPRDKVLIAASIVFTIMAELAFTLYVSVFGISNLIGHILKLFSFWLIYKSIIASNLQAPYATLQKSKDRFKQLFENAEISIWNEDFSKVYAELTHLRHEGVKDLEAYLLSNIDVAWDLARKIKVIEVNDATKTLFAAKSKESLMTNVASTFGPDAIYIFIKELCAIWNKDKVFRSESTYLTFDGKQIDALVSFQIPDTVDGFRNIPVSLIDITKRKEAEKRIWQQANFDSLTGLANRSLFVARLASAIDLSKDKQYRVAVLFIDLDRFKNVNDTLGHSLGDYLLQEVANRLLGNEYALDTVARFGGDEFAVLLSHDTLQAGNSSESDIKNIVTRILEDLAKPYSLQGHDAFISASIGVTVFPEDGETIETLLRKADSAMYIAKEKGRNNFQFFTKDIDIGALRKRELEKALRVALDRGEFSLNYQPIVDVQNGGVAGVEALIRWHQPEKGAISPVEFIPLAEEIGLILPIGEWVLRKACSDAFEWSKLVKSPPRISVNVSGVQFQRQDMPQLVQSILIETGLPAQRLTLEITEGLLLSDDDETLSQFQKIRALGVELSIDDFGTGYSSLSYLKKFPISTLKIDRSFIMNLPSNIEETALVNAILAMAESLSLKVVAEGVETQAQADFLKEKSCQFIQGYLYSRPLPSQEFKDYLITNSPVI